LWEEEEVVVPIASAGKEYNFVKIQTFSGEDDEDAMDWVRQFTIAAEANNWNPNRYTKIAGGYLQGAAADWYEEAQPSGTGVWEFEGEDSFSHTLVKHFFTPERQDKWFYELTNIKQKPTEKVDIYTSRFRRLSRKGVTGTEEVVPDIVMKDFSLTD